MNKNDFSMTSKWTMFDSGAITFKPQIMIDAVVDFYTNKVNNPHSADSELAIEVIDKITETRITIAKLINCKKEEVVFTSGTSHGANMLISSIAERLQKNDEVIVFKDSHASGVIPWLAAAKNKGIKLLFIIKDKEVTKVVNKNTKAIWFSQINNTTGHSHDTKYIYKTVKKISPKCIVINDAAQAIVHGIIDFKYNDALVFSGSKLYGPTGTGGLIIKEELMNELTPQEYGGGANKRFTTTQWVPEEGYKKWEVGTPNAAGIIGLGVAIKYVQNIGVKNIIDDERKISIYLYDKLKQFKGIHIFSKKTSPIILFYIKGKSSQKLVVDLAKKNILLRAGYHCAGIMREVLNYDGATLRASLGLYTDKEDVDKLITTLKECLQ